MGQRKNKCYGAKKMLVEVTLSCTAFCGEVAGKHVSKVWYQLKYGNFRSSPEVKLKTRRKGTHQKYYACQEGHEVFENSCRAKNSEVADLIDF
jgi:hypothetical protein